VDGILDWYLLGLVIGLGVAAGVAGVGGLGSGGSSRLLWGALGLAALAGAVVLAALVLEWWGVVAVVVAALVGWLSFRRLSPEAVPAAELVALAAAAIPVAGYVLLVLSPVLGQRLGRRADSRHAGLRILAKD
jgi:hypothetical protein